jgi:hypothetical protein
MSIARPAALAALFLAAAAPAEAQQKEPPACSAISFRPVASGLADGQHPAGLYRSRFGTIAVMAEVRSGAAQHYFVFHNGKRPQALAGGAPKSAEPCLKAKNITLPVTPAGKACLGDRFRVVVDRTGGQRHLMLFALQGKEWLLCSASQV